MEVENFILHDKQVIAEGIAEEETALEELTMALSSADAKLVFLGGDSDKPTPTFKNTDPSTGL